MLYPHKVRCIMAGQEIVITTNRIEHNAEIPEDRLAHPRDIAELVDKERMAGTGSHKP